MLLLGNKDGFRVIQICQDEAQSAENGMPFSRVATKYWQMLDGSLWASCETHIRGVAPLGKDQAIACEARLATKRFTTR